MKRDSWNPAQYDRFKRERQQPFWDLLNLVKSDRIESAVDLGAGTGELTAALHKRLHVTSTLGIDRSQAMLTKALPLAGNGLSFQEASVETWSSEGGVDLVFSNATLQWLDDHPALISRLVRSLRPRGQLAVQVPANHDHPSHVVAEQVAAMPRFKAALNGYVRRSPVLPVDAYAEILYATGCREQEAVMRVYGHVLGSVQEVVEWVKGTLLTDYEARLSTQDFAAFVDAYRSALTAALGNRQPYFYPFKRILLWGRR